jgi:hypothetical protein
MVLGITASPVPVGQAEPAITKDGHQNWRGEAKCWVNSLKMRESVVLFRLDPAVLPPETRQRCRAARNAGSTQTKGCTLSTLRGHNEKPQL